MPFEHVSPGQRLRIPAGDYNAAMDAARAFRLGRLTRPPSSVQPARRSNIDVPVYNALGVDLARHDAVWVASTFPEPDVGLTVEDSEFYRLGAVASIAMAPDAGELAKAAILLDGINAGEIGLARLTGLIACQLEIDDAGHQYAAPQDGGGPPISVPGGPFAILWAESDTGTVRALLEVLPTRPLPGIVIGQITTAPTGQAQASAVSYTVYAGTLALPDVQPLLRPFAATQLIQPAQIGDWAIVLVGLEEDELLAVPEVQVVEDCAAAASALIAPGDVDDTHLMLSRDGEIMFSRGGNAMVSRDADASTNAAADLLMASADRSDVMYSPDGFALIAHNTTAVSTVWDSILTSRDRETMVPRTPAELLTESPGRP